MTSVLVRYHEIALKRNNRPFFLNLLRQNLSKALAGLGMKSVATLPGRLLLSFNERCDPVEIRSRIERVFGLVNFSFVERTPLDLEILRTRILDAIDGKSFDSFRITTQRGDKSFPLTSPEINRLLGAAVQAKCGAPVDLTSPAFTVSVEILPGAAFFGFDKLPGAGGLPVGSSGKLVTLLSGGIDSPVAAYRMMKRGCRLIFVHFHSVPYLDRTSQEKARSLVKHLTRCQFSSRLYLVPFGDIQRQIVASVPRPLRVVLYRRSMMRIAGRIAQKEGAGALATGESLAQVASQTLENLAVIEQASELPILRPLVGMDKQEIIDQARRIGTFDISAIPDQDCCQLFVPRHPATKARLRDVEQAESGLDIETWVAESAEKAEIEEFRFP